MNRSGNSKVASWRWLLVVAAVVGLMLIAAPAALAASISVCASGCDYTTIQGAVIAAAPGDTINVSAGTYTLSSNVDVNKANLSLIGAGAGSTFIKVSGADPRLSLLASGVTVQGFDIEKTDKAGVQNIIWINGSNVTIKNNTIHGQFVIGDGDVSRAIVISGGLTGLNIEGNTIYALRQPGYISGVTTGDIKDNTVYGTKGWVLEQGDMTFTNNHWGTGNVFDIAILSGVGPAYYTDIVAMSNANNGAVIEDQRAVPAVLSVVYVDDSAAPGGDGGQVAPYQTIAPAITRVVAGGTIKVAAGTYVEQVEIAKDLTLKGVGAGTVIQSPATLTKSFSVAGGSLNKPVVYVHGASSVTIQDLVVDGAGLGNANYRFQGIGYHNAGGKISGVEIKDVRDTPFSGSQHGVALYAYNEDATARTLEVAGCNIHDFQKNGTALGGPGLTVNVHDTTVTGYGPTATTAQNGIQVSYGATGSVGPNNHVSAISYTPSTWVASGILLYDADVNVTGNDVTNAQAGIYLYLGNSDIQNNVVTASEAGVGTTVFSGIVVIDPPHALPSPYQDEVLSASASAAAAPQAVITANVTGNTLTGSCTTDSFGVEAYAGYYGTDDLVLTVSGNTIANWGYGVTIAQCTSGCTTGTFASALVNNNIISNNCEYGMYVDGLASPVDAEGNYWGAVSGPGPVGPGSGDKVTTNVDFQPWCNADFSNCTYGWPSTVSMQVSSSPAEVGDVVTMDTLVTADDVYGMQLRVNFDSDKLEFQAPPASSHNDVSAAGWYWDFVSENFVAVTGGTRLSGSMSTHPTPAMLTGQSVATWKFKCLKAGTWNLTYDQTADFGTYLATKESENIPATLTNATVECIAATASVDGWIKLQGRQPTNPVPAAWQGADVTLTCVASSGCDGFGPYTMTTDASGHYEHLKTATPGSGVVQGTYSATVARRAYLGAAKTTNVVVGPGSNTINTLATAPRLLGGDVINPAGIDIFDLSAIGGVFGTTVMPADTGNDVNGDGVINIFDLVLAGGNFDKTFPQPW